MFQSFHFFSMSKGCILDGLGVTFKVININNAHQIFHYLHKAISIKWLRITKISFFLSLNYAGFFFNWDLLQARLNSHYDAWSYKKKKHRKTKTYTKSV